MIYIFLFMFVYIQKEKNNTAKVICAIYGHGAVADYTVSNCFAVFTTVHFELQDRERSALITVLEHENLNNLIKITYHMLREKC